ncbi:MAG: DUF2507 domain-containing protein [Alkalibacterium sp.]|nr:DUF2507 domain-containing protein [Alkalibacterium sp.]
MSADSTKHSPLEGITLLRDQLLPNLLKEDQSDILYWAGKELARSYTVASIEDISPLMRSLSFGALSLIEHKKASYLFHMQGEIVHSRLKKNPKADFALETGFLAQIMQQISEQYTEGSYTLQKKTNVIEIVLQSDKKEPIH